MDSILTADEMVTLLKDKWGAAVTRANIPSLNDRLTAGKGLAVYENSDMGSVWRGHIKVVSYGHEDAYFTTSEPPQTLPDTDREINYRYQLLAAYRGDALAPPADDDTTGMSAEEAAAVEYARDKRERGYTDVQVLTYRTALDNREPHHRNHREATGYAVRYTSSDAIDAEVNKGTRATGKWQDRQITLFCAEDGLAQERVKGQGAIVDIAGEGAAPYWSGSYSPPGHEGVPYVLLSRFSGHQAGDRYPWQLGPRVYVHLIMTPAEG